MVMQVKISFTLDVKKEISKKELEELLDDCCPLELSKNANEFFAVSTERWAVIE